MHGLGHHECQPLANRAPQQYPAGPLADPGPRPGIRLAKQTAAKRDPRVSVDQEMPDLASSTARPGSAGQLLPPGTATAASHISPMSSATSQASQRLN